VNALLTVLLADNNWDMHGDVSTGWMIVMMILMVLFWAAVILGIVWLVRGASGGGWHWGGERKETPSEILERRFAEGAISVQDYHERRNVIAGGTRDDQAAGDD
jgi:putative membrane protein